jgi:ATP-sulfurylase
MVAASSYPVSCTVAAKSCASSTLLCAVLHVASSGPAAAGCTHFIILLCAVLHVASSAPAAAGCTHFIILLCAVLHVASSGPAAAGCTHFIIGRDMAGCKSTVTGVDFYGAYDAQEIAGKNAAELNMQVSFIAGKNAAVLNKQVGYI